MLIKIQMLISQGQLLPATSSLQSVPWPHTNSELCTHLLLPPAICLSYPFFFFWRNFLSSNLFPAHHHLEPPSDSAGACLNSGHCLFQSHEANMPTMIKTVIITYRSADLWFYRKLVTWIVNDGLWEQILRFHGSRNLLLRSKKQLHSTEFIVFHGPQHYGLTLKAAFPTLKAFATS